MEEKTLSVVYVKAEPELVANCYKQFLLDVIKDKVLFSSDLVTAVKYTLKGLSQKATQRIAVSGCNLLFEQIIADVLLRNYRTTSTADDLGFTNAVGYDVCDPRTSIYVEAKSYSVNQRSSGGNSSQLSANISNLRNKFCSVVALILDPYLLSTKQYRIYVLPANTLPSDETDYLNIQHHNLKLYDEYTIINTLPNLGSDRSKFIIPSLRDLISPTSIETLKMINMKRLAEVLKNMHLNENRSISQENEFIHLVGLWDGIIKTVNKKGKTRYPATYLDELYQIADENNTRLFFNGSKIL